MFLPASSPELNPIEQVWKILVNKLQRVPLGVKRSAGSHACAHAAIEILSTITHEIKEKDSPKNFSNLHPVQVSVG